MRQNPRRLWLLRVYGITLAEREALAKRQGGRCAICRRKAKTLCVDHDHDTGFVRGLLCFRCNQALGFFGDSVQSLKQAMEYMADAYADWDELSPNEQGLWWPYRGRINGKARAKRIASVSRRPSLTSLESI